MRTIQSHIYEESPISEAIFEIVVEPREGAKWDDSLAERLLQRFPSYEQEERAELIDYVVELGPKGQVQQRSHPRGERIRRWNSDRTRLIQFGPTLCAHNVLSAYETFDAHLPQARDLFEAYLTEWKPLHVKRIGQRYLNTIRLPTSAESGADYFEIYPTLPSQIRVDHPSLAVQVETVRFENGITVINLSFKGVDDGHPVYLLDIYARSKDSVPSQVDGIIAWQRQAHQAVTDSFELSITDKSRELFQEVKP